MDIKVSVIVPVYSVELWLDRCVKSILMQSFQDIEIILVDDGSPDRCPEMCDQYATQYSNVKVVHKKNGGLASARNAGMQVAKGQYILFIDSDDWIDEDTIEVLVEKADKYNVDFVRFRPMFAGWPSHQDGELCDFGTEKGMEEGLYERNRIVSEIFPRLIATPQLTMGVIVSAWRSLYRRSFLIKNNLQFDEDIRYSEDSIFSAKLVYVTNSFFYLDGPRFYHYFFNPASITKSFKADRWYSCQKLVFRFEEAFSDCKDFDFSNQLYLEKIFCVMQALSQRKLISDYCERKKYCAEICNDEIAKCAFQHINLVKVPFKLKVLLLLVKNKWIGLLARI